MTIIGEHRLIYIYTSLVYMYMYLSNFRHEKPSTCGLNNLIHVLSYSIVRVGLLNHM